MPNEQLEMWGPYKIKHAPVTMSAKKVEPDRQPARNYSPDEEIVGVFRGHVDAKVIYERTEKGLWQKSFNITVTEFYEHDDAEGLLEEGHANTVSALMERLGGEAREDIDVTISHTGGDGKRHSVKTTTGEISRIADQVVSA